MTTPFFQMCFLYQKRASPSASRYRIAVMCDQPLEPGYHGYRTRLICTAALLPSGKRLQKANWKPWPI